MNKKNNELTLLECQKIVLDSGMRCSINVFHQAVKQRSLKSRLEVLDYKVGPRLTRLVDHKDFVLWAENREWGKSKKHIKIDYNLFESAH